MPRDPSHDPPGWVLSYDEPVNEFEYRLAAMPLGNGRIGCMLSGGAARELVLLNHVELRPPLYGEGSGRAPPLLGEVRALARAGSWKQAAETLERMAAGAGCSRELNPYHPAGDLVIRMALPASATGYERTLDLAEGVARVSFAAADCEFRRTTFVSFPDDAMVMRIESDRPASVSCDVSLGRRPVAGCELDAAASPSVLRLSGSYSVGLAFEIRTTVVSVGGAAVVRQGTYHGPGVDGGNFGEELVALSVTGADAVTLLTRIGVTRRSGDAEAHLDTSPPAQSYEELLERHRADHEPPMCRVRLSLDGAGGPTGLTTDRLLHEAYLGRPAGRLLELLFQMGRYLLMGSSRPGTEAANLQGIWNDTYAPPWQARYQLDFNIQACYWLADPTNLAECTLPFFDLVDSVVERAESFALDLYGCRGVLLGVGTDGDRVRYGANYETTCIAGWLAAHYWEHYLFSADEAFLRERAYPFMRKVALFYEDFLYKDEVGRYAILPSNSPENNPANRPVRLSLNATIDVAVARELLGNVLEASRVLGVDAGRRPVWEELLDHLPRWLVTADGALAEWIDPTAEANDGHRHLSHLYPLFPGSAFDPDTTPELVRAALEALARRERGFREDACSFSYLWPALIYTRAGRGEEAYARLCLYLRGFVMPNLLSSMGDWRQQGLGRLRGARIASHIFQIETALATTALIAEMLLQSHGGILRILPALPAAWPDGRVEGLRARGGLTVGISWSKGRLLEAGVVASRRVTCTVKLCAPPEGPVSVEVDGAALSAQGVAPHTFHLEIEPGRRYRIRGGAS